MYTWISKPIRFNSAAGAFGNAVSNRKLVFSSEESFERWFKFTTAHLAQLDEPLNYCKYFKREKGNDGYYERDGFRFPVNGEWDGYHLNCGHKKDLGFVCCSMKGFKEFLISHGFFNDWWELKPQYLKHLDYKDFPLNV